MSVPETTLQMARRHMAESQERISRQETLIARLTRGGHLDMLPDADVLLDQMRGFLTLTEAHLARLIAESAG